MNIKDEISKMEGLVSFQKILVNTIYGSLPKLYYQYNFDKYIELKHELHKLRKLELRINKINKIKDKIYEHKIQILG